MYDVIVTIPYNIQYNTILSAISTTQLQQLNGKQHDQLGF